MKKAVLLGLDKVDTDNSISFFCKGIVLSLLNYHVDVFYDPKAENLSVKKAALIERAFPKVTMHQLKDAIDENCKKMISEADIVIVNPMPYSVAELDYFASLDKHVYYDLAGLAEYKKEYQQFAKAGYLVYMDNENIVIDMIDTMKDIVSSKAKYALVFDVSGGINALAKKAQIEYMSLFVEPTRGDFFFLASIYLAGIIYALENGYTITVAMRIATALVDIITKNGSDSISLISEEGLLKKYSEEFESLDE